MLWVVSRDNIVRSAATCEGPRGSTTAGIGGGDSRPVPSGVEGFRQEAAFVLNPVCEKRWAVTPSPMPPPNSSLVKVFYAALALFGVFVAFLGGVAVVGIYQGFTRGRKALDSAYEAGVKGPGAAEVRAAGCPQALVMGPAEYRDMKLRFSDEKPTDPSVSMFVVCKGRGKVPDCATVARAYAVAPNRLPGNFLVSVQSPGSTCSRRYSESGQELGGPDRP